MSDLIVLATDIPEVIEVETESQVVSYAPPEVILVADDAQSLQLVAEPETVIESQDVIQLVSLSDTEVVTDRWETLEILEVAAQGPAGVPGVGAKVFQAREIDYTGGDIVEMRLYALVGDVLPEQTRSFLRTSGRLVGIEYRDSAGTLFSTKSFTYAPDGSLTRVEES